MKRIVASFGLAALGAACVQSSNAQADGSKPWTASVALRGFYDDNLNGAKSSKVETFGIQINPSLGFALRTDQTTASFGYTYGYLYYDEKPLGNTSHSDQTHTFAASLSHAFDERTTLSVSDSFVIGQEPDLLRAGAADATFQRISGQNVRNFGQLTINHEFTRTFGLEVGYANSYFNYEDDIYAVQSIFGIPVGVIPSQSGLLDRIEQVLHVDARWTIRPTTVALIGYAFNWSHYSADEPIGAVLDPNPFNNYLIYSDARDSQSHIVYAGAEHTFSPGLHGKLRVGAQFTDYFRSPEGQSETSPYVLASLNYDVSKDSSFQIGLSEAVGATDTFSPQGSSITTGAENTVVYASFTHRILPALIGSLMGQFQNSRYNGGQFDGDSDQYYLLNASLEYQFDRHLSATLSYHYDLLESDIPGRGFDRNRVFLGATFTY